MPDLQYARRTTRAVGVSVVALLVATSLSCRSPASETAPSSSHGFDVGVSDDWPDVYKEVAQQAWLYAQMADNSYGREVPFQLPPNVHLMKEYHDSLGTGFGYNLYEIREPHAPNAVDQIVIAFRGTDGILNGRDNRYGNFGWTQNGLAESLYDSLKRVNPSTRFVVTGHSLGGALALQVSTNNDSVDAFVFNSSYHFRNVKHARADRYSIAEKIEAVSAVRGLLRNPTIWHHPWFNCSDGNFVTRHYMPALAWCVTRVAAFTDTAAQRSVTMNPAIREMVEGRPLVVDTLPMAPDSLEEALRPADGDDYPLRRRRWWHFW